MKKSNVFMVMALSLFIGVVIFSCKKTVQSATDTLNNTYASDSKTQSVDATLVNGETDQAQNDVDNTLASNAKMSGSGNVSSNLAPTYLTVDSSSSLKTITLIYKGITSGVRTRSGKITVDLISGNRWSDVGAVIQYRYDSFKVYNTYNHKTILINGTRTVTNVSGGNIYNLSLRKTTLLTHKIRANYSLTFTDSTGTKTAQWNVARKTDIAMGIVGIYQFTTSGDTTINGYSNVESWGTTRNNKSFTTSFVTPIISNTSCGLWRPTTGGIAHVVGVFPFGIQLGLDASGNQVLSGCADYYKVTWSNVAGAALSLLLPY